MLFKKTQLLVFLFTIIFSSFTFSQTTCNDTSWDKGVDFNGDLQHLQQVSLNTSYNPLRMNGIGAQVPANSDSSKTANSSYSRPWATTVVFKADGNNSTQYIWNSGNRYNYNDNIYLKLDASNNLYFGWGRYSSNNECIIYSNIPTTEWIGIYIAHKGQRFIGSTSTQLAGAFDIRIMTSGDGFNSVGTNKSIANSWVQTGQSMIRPMQGSFTIGGRAGTYNYYGKVASMVVATLKVNHTMPTDAEIKLMITDPKKWENDYREGTMVRSSTSDANGEYNPDYFQYGYAGTQIWLMGDGTSDSYANGIRNEVNNTDQNYTKLQLNNNMQNSIQSVNISGFSEAACRATSAIFGTETTSTLNLESFTAPSGGADGYAIYINDSNSFTAPSNGDEPTADLSWNGSGQQPVYFGTSASPDITVTDLDPGTTYYFQVYAYNDSSGTETYETTGLNASDATTADTTPPTAPTAGPASATTVTGTAEAGSTVTVYASNGTTVLGTATANSSGNYSVTLSPAQSNSSTLSVTSTDASGNESEATTTRVVIGITFEGPAANQTGTNVMDAGDHGWISLNETLAAGERLVLDNAFLENLLNKMRESGDNSNTTGINCTIGLRGPNFTNTAEIHGHDTSGQFLGNHYIRIIALGVRTRQAGWVIHSNGVNGNNGSVNTTSGFASMCGFLEITSDGNNLRAGMGTNGSYGVVQGDESTKTYSDWNGYKRETGDQGYGITSEDVVMGFWTFNAGDFDGDLVDWTDITEVSVPAPAAPDAPTVSTASADTVTGTAEAGSTVTVTDSNGDVIGTATADSDGNYSVTLSPEQSD